ncbi:MAG: hydantoinase/oxoprolinase family protein [Rhodospirillaceae bacterium]|nr:hydantoinase/oxoprolinase family protein [Rhodospirillaceae bacterium]
MSYRLGIDIGGTFTDFVLLSENGDLVVAKTPSNPEDLKSVILAGLEQLAEEVSRPVADLVKDVDIIVHGTTIATNALIQGRLAKAGMICTKGFRDVLELREGLKEERYNYRVDPPAPLVPRHLRLAVDERIIASGAIHQPLDERDVRAAAETFRAEGVEAVAVALLWSVINPSHELRVGEILREELPGVPVFLSSEVAPNIREYPRFSTTALCAALGPLLSQYTDRVETTLREIGYANAVRYIQCNGGTTSGSLLKACPALALDSGPAAGPAAGLFFGKMFGYSDVISMDMGGTSLDVSLVHNGHIETSTNVDVHRYRLSVPKVVVNTLGAGGGSIGWIDDSGMLRMGPRSAEAYPGPACYDRGGELPTVTDANVALGYFSADHLLGGRMAINSSLAHQAISTNLAEPLSVPEIEAARAMYTIVNENMANEVRRISTERGYDVRDFAFVAGGGCSPAHAVSVAAALDVETVIVPRAASVLCAFGAAITDVRHDHHRTYMASLSGCDLSIINNAFEEMTAAAAQELTEEGFPDTQRDLRRTMDIRYDGEIGELTIPIDSGPVDAAMLETIRTAFDQAHERIYTFADPNSGCQIMSLGLAAIGRRTDSIDHIQHGDSGDQSFRDAVMTTRTAWFDENSAEIPVYDGARVKPGEIAPGPAVVEEATTTIVVPPGWDIRLDPRHVWVITRAPA